MNPGFLSNIEASDTATESRVSPEGRLCSQVILEALHDIRFAQAGSGQYGGRPYESAVIFFFQVPSPLDWMCAGIGIEEDRVREKALELLQEREPERDIPTTMRKARRAGALRGRRLEAGR